MKHRILALLLIAGLLFGATGCGRTPAIEDKTEWGQYVTLGAYKGIEIAPVNTKVSEEQLDETIQSVLESFTTLSEVDRAATHTDTVHVDYTGKMNGKKFEGGTITGEDLDIATSDYIPGLAEGMIGKKAGDAFTLDLTMPTDYWVDEVAGQDVTYDVIVYSVYERNVPELTDELVQQVSEDSDTIADYRKELRTEMETMAVAEAENVLAQAVWAKVVEGSTILEYPEEELSAYKEQTISYYQDEADANSLDLETFLIEEHGLTKEDVLLDAEQFGKSEVGDRVIARAIAQAEKIFLTEEEYQERAINFAKDWSMATVEELEQEQGKEAVYQALVWEDVLDWVVAQSKQVEALALSEDLTQTEDIALIKGEDDSTVVIPSDEEPIDDKMQVEPEVVG